MTDEKAYFTIYQLCKSKGLALEEIIRNYQPSNEKTFPLNENYGEFRGALDAFFTEEQLKQPILIKEITWETNDSTLLTIWFIKKQMATNRKI